MNTYETAQLAVLTNTVAQLLSGTYLSTMGLQYIPYLWYWTKHEQDYHNSKDKAQVCGRHHRQMLCLKFQFMRLIICIKWSNKESGEMPYFPT